MALGGTIRGKKTRLRLPVEGDLAHFNDWLADMRVRRAAAVWQEPAMPATWKERLAEAAKEKGTVLWAIETTGAVPRHIGLARVFFAWPPFAEQVVVASFVLDPDEWRKGYGTDAAVALHRYLFDYLNLRFAEVVIDADNVAGLRIVERLGYREYARGHEARYRDGAYVDQVRLTMDRDAWHERWDATEREYPPLAAEALR